jgi:hypothetical protein
MRVTLKNVEPGRDAATRWTMRCASFTSPPACGDEPSLHRPPLLGKGDLGARPEA